MVAGGRLAAFLSTVAFLCTWQQLLVPAGAVLLGKGNIITERQSPQQFLQPTVDAFLADAGLSERRRKQSADASLADPATFTKMMTTSDPSGAPSQGIPPIIVAPSQVTPPIMLPLQETTTPTTQNDAATASPPTMGAAPSMESMIPQLPFDSIATAAAINAVAGLPTVGGTPQAGTPTELSEAGQHFFDGSYKNQSDSIENLRNQAEILRQNRQKVEQDMASLQAKADDAEEDLKAAKEKEAAAKEKLEATINTRTDQEMRSAISNERWNQQMSQLDDKLTTISEQAKQEQEDRNVAEALVNAAETQKTEQALQAAKVITDEQTSQAYQDGAKAQQEFDQATLKKMGQALKEASTSAARAASTQKKMDNLATEAGKYIGDKAKSYEPGTPVAEAIANALADVAISAEATKAQDEAVDISGVSTVGLG